MADPTREEIHERIENTAEMIWKTWDCPVGKDLDIWLEAEKIIWSNISACLKLSEDFIREFKDKVWWCYISQHQKLSESFIREFHDKMSWHHVSKCQKLSEDLIKEFKDKLDWSYISKYQKLSEDLIREFQDKVDWNLISKYQKLSEDLIREFKDKVDWNLISQYQKLSEEFIKEFNVIKPGNNWLYATKEEKLKYIKEKTNYQVIDDEYIVAYKSTKEDGTSIYNRHYVYEVGKTYESNCDCNLDYGNSFGLSAWTKKGALVYYKKGKLFLVKIYINDIGAIVHDSNKHDSNKIRCFKLEVLEEVSKDG